MTIDVDVAIADGRWRGALGPAEALCREAVRAALAAAGVGRAGGLEVAVLLTDDGRVRALNRRFRAIDKPTNVLSFASAGGPAAPAEEPQAFGDVVLAYETVAGEARRQGKTVADHVRHLLVHGALHLAGYDHGDDRQAAVMEGLETSVLAGLGVANPYRAPDRTDALP